MMSSFSNLYFSVIEVKQDSTASSFNGGCSDLVDKMPRFTDPTVITSIESTIVAAMDAQNKLKYLPKLADHETIDTAKTKLGEIESFISNQLWEKIWELVLSPFSIEMDGNERHAHIEKECARIEKESRAAKENERVKYNEMITLFETYDSLEKILSDAEAKLFTLSDCDYDYKMEQIEICDKGSKLLRRIKLSNSRLRKGLPDPQELKMLLCNSSSKEVIMNILNLFYFLTRKNEVFYEYIHKAKILDSLKYFIKNENEDPNIRVRAFKVVAGLCSSSSYYYNALKEHGIISLVIDLSSHSHQKMRQISCYTIKNAAINSDLLYDELRRCIPQFTKLLHNKEEEDKTKMYVVSALKYLVKNSNKLVEDIVSKGALKALIHLVAEHSELIPKEEGTKSLIHMILKALNKIYIHEPCTKFILSSEMFSPMKKIIQSPNPRIAKSRFARKLTKQM